MGHGGGGSGLGCSAVGHGSAVFCCFLLQLLTFSALPVAWAAPPSATVAWCFAAFSGSYTFSALCRWPRLLRRRPPQCVVLLLSVTAAHFQPLAGGLGCSAVGHRSAVFCCILRQLLTFSSLPVARAKSPSATVARCVAASGDSCARSATCRWPGLLHRRPP